MSLNIRLVASKGGGGGGSEELRKAFILKFIQTNVLLDNKL